VIAGKGQRHEDHRGLRCSQGPGEAVGSRCLGFSWFEGASQAQIVGAAVQLNRGCSGCIAINFVQVLAWGNLMNES
jgi:hypothetical protein